MRSLAVRYLKHRAKIERKIVHVVDPFLDFSEYFKNVDKLSDNIKKRGLSGPERLDVERIHDEYYKWWRLFQDFTLCGDDADAKEKLLQAEEGLFLALSLPNHLGKESMFLNTMLAQTQKTIMKCPTLPCATSNPLILTKHLRTHFIQQLINNVNPRPISLRVPYMVREALLDVCNLSHQNYAIAFEGNNPYFKLVGVSLPAMISPFIQQSIIEASNSWPIIFYSTGASYNFLEGSAYQTKSIAILALSRTEEECSTNLAYLFDLIFSFIKTNVSDAVMTKEVNPADLFKFERSALLISSDDEQLNLCRISDIGNYIAKRGNIVFEQKANFEFLFMGFIQLDVSKLSQLL